jgi:hypothetical protein
MLLPSAVTLHDKSGALIGLEQWMTYQEDPDYKHVVTTQSESGWRLETVWTGINYTPSRPYPQLFETRIYRGEARQWREVDLPNGIPRLRWGTKGEALAGHQQAAKWLRLHILTLRAAKPMRPLAGI